MCSISGSGYNVECHTGFDDHHLLFAYFSFKLFPDMIRKMKNMQYPLERPPLVRMRSSSSSHCSVNPGLLLLGIFGSTKDMIVKNSHQCRIARTPNASYTPRRRISLS